MLRNLSRSLFLAAALSLGFAPVVQAATLSNYLENKLIDHLFRGTAYTAPATQYVALATGAGSDAACGTEVTGGSYARVAFTNNTTNWANTQASGTGVSSGTSGTTSNLTAITFPTPSASWGTVVEVCVFDASTSGNLLWRQALSVAKTVNSGDTVDFPVASLTFQIDN